MIVRIFLNKQAASLAAAQDSLSVIKGLGSAEDAKGSHPNNGYSAITSTGSSMADYRASMIELVSASEQAKAWIGQALFFNQDEYARFPWLNRPAWMLFRQLGNLSSLPRWLCPRAIPDTHPQSYRKETWEEFLQPMGAQHSNMHSPAALDYLFGAGYESFDELIEQTVGLVEESVLGVGENGHTGFNEPPIQWYWRTRLVALDLSTIRANSRFFEGRVSAVPRFAYTIGPHTTFVLAKRVRILAFGEKKANAIARGIDGPVTGDCPWSFARCHKDATVYLDLEAAKHLRKYEEVSRKVTSANHSCRIELPKAEVI